MVTEKVLGYLKNGDPVKIYEMANENHMKVEVVSIGASLHSMRLKDRNEKYVNVIVGLDTIAGCQKFFLNVSAFLNIFRILQNTNSNFSEFKEAVGAV